MSRFQRVASDPCCYRFIAFGEWRTERKHSFFDMTDVVEDAETGQETGGNLTDILTEGFMESFAPGLENLQGRLGELT